MTPMKVLIIDDVPSLRQSLRDTLEEEAGWEVEDHGFDGLGDTLLRFRPDMLILDLVEDQGVDGQATGNTSFEEIRETWFCPVVVYSAFIERQDFHHPLVVSVTKGQDTELEVRDHLKDFISAAKMIRSVHRDFDARVREGTTRFSARTASAGKHDRRRSRRRGAPPRRAQGGRRRGRTRGWREKRSSSRGNGSSYHRWGIIPLRPTC